MSGPKKFPTITHRERADDAEGTMARLLNSMKSMPRGPLVEDDTVDAVDEMGQPPDADQEDES